MSSGLAIALGGLAVTAGALSEVLRQRVMVPAIREASAYSVGVSVFTLYLEAREYRAHCLARGASLRWWRVWWGSHVVFVASLVGAGGVYLASIG